MTLPEHMELEFFGAAGEVTGSCHVLRIGDRRILLECGMLQGGRQQAARNREPFPLDPESLDAVIISHAHIDHCGRLPLLVRRGYSGPVFAQQATRDVARVMLEDSAGLAERDAEQESVKRARKGLPPVEPLYTVDDARQALRQFETLSYDDCREVVPGVRLRFIDAGHIIGSAIVELWLSEGGYECKLVFSGDLGQRDTPILRDPSIPDSADLVVMESTYGDRCHRSREATLLEIASVLRGADHQQGNVLIPAFAVGRTQELLYLFSKYWHEWDLARWQIFLDSPMAIRASDIYWRHRELYDEEAQAMRAEHEEMPKLPNLSLSQSPEESMAINRIRKGAIIIAGSGMCEGGRIVHHLKHNVWRPECQVLIVGYQAQGTVGRRLVDGESYIRIHHEAIRVKAQVHTIGGLSAHADQSGLTEWYEAIPGRPPLWLVHGEPGASAALREHLLARGAPRVIVAEPGMRIEMARLPQVHRRANQA
ncbi:MAG: MBL fold metallo-hydrolase [Chromatiales bacterium]|nr:MBL fold metallo-hydrolase [Chromatiales bacterium]